MSIRAALRASRLGLHVHRADHGHRVHTFTEDVCRCGVVRLTHAPLGRPAAAWSSTWATRDDVRAQVRAHFAEATA